MNTLLGPVNFYFRLHSITGRVSVYHYHYLQSVIPVFRIFLSVYVSSVQVFLINFIPM